MEVTNREIIKRIKKKLKKAKRAWTKELNYIFWALRMIEKFIIGETSFFFFINRVDAFIPVEIGAKSFWV